jgi:carbamoyl-phosphate synthase large subunit
MNILLTNTGRRTYFIEYMLNLKINNLKIFITDTNKNVPTFFISKKIKKILTIGSKKKDYINQIIQIVKRNKIDVVIPLSDHDVKSLSNLKKKNIFPNTKFIVSEENVINICLNKIKTNHFLKINNIPYAPIYKKLTNSVKFPLILKKIEGSRSDDQKIINSKNDLTKFSKKFFLQKFIKGREFNVDILNDLKGNFVSCSVKEKILMRAGETDRCKIVFSSKFLEFSKKLSKCLRHIGNIDVDLIVKNDRIFVIDINPRFGGGYPATHESGLNYIKFLILAAQNIKFRLPIINKSKIVMSKGISIYIS